MCSLCWLCLLLGKHSKQRKLINRDFDENIPSAARSCYNIFPFRRQKNIRATLRAESLLVKNLRDFIKLKARCVRDLKNKLCVCVWCTKEHDDVRIARTKRERQERTLVIRLRKHFIKFSHRRSFFRLDFIFPSTRLTIPMQTPPNEYIDSPPCITQARGIVKLIINFPTLHMALVIVMRKPAFDINPIHPTTPFDT